MKRKLIKVYEKDLTPVSNGDKVEFNLHGNYALGGRYCKRGTGVINDVDDPYGVIIKVTKLDYHYDCSQRFGSSEPSKRVRADTDWNPTKYQSADNVQILKQVELIERHQDASDQQA